MSKKSGFSFWLGMGLGAATGWYVAQQKWAMDYLARQDIRRTLDTPQNQISDGLTFEAQEDAPAYTVRRMVQDGIERVVYSPKQRRFETPLLFVHGMWHGAWCWQEWQELFAAWGWESVSFSQPGHAGSPEQRPIRLCTLDYYLSFVQAEVERLPRKPVLIGHSMGGALTQWYLKHVGDDLPAAVLVAPWPHQTSMSDGIQTFFLNDPLGFLMMFLDWSATPLVRSPQGAARLLISPQAPITPQALHAQLGPESVLILMHHLTRFWTAPQNLRTPMLLIAGEADALLAVETLRRTAEHYGASFHVAPGAGHNVQMDVGSRKSAEHVASWLEAQDVQ